MISYSRNLFTGPILSHLEGDKLLLPPFVLEEILRAGSGSKSDGFAIATHDRDDSDFSNTHLPYPIVFQIFNPKTRLITHGGVKEFNSADEKAYLPPWMYDSLSLKEGEEVTIRLKELPKGTWARFRPMTMDYKDIMDYRAAFEAYLRSYYTTLTTGEILTIKQADNSYQFLVDSLKPEDAVQIVDTDLEYGDLLEKDKHELIFHTLRKCSCKYESESLQDLARHKRTTCPDRLITCKFCRNLVKQDEPSTNPQDLLEGLTVHESYCGARTIKCVKCEESVTLRNVRAHANMHEIEKQNRKLPKLCRNENCIKPAANNILKLCSTCFGPFWSPTADPTGRMLYTRLGRKYHQQLTVGCGNSWCTNMYCATGNSIKKDPNTAASTILPHLQQIQLSQTTPIYLCVDELTTRRRFLADILYKGKDLANGDGGGECYEKYPIEFCVKAVEIENEDLVEARKWLQANAPIIVRK
ncbi:23751_t:CDS:2 [Entrophospora sp. SA101]|nr:10977_t:CDS:2 [Entrophospora sp. SA101]CAJ0633503.1 9558_t:CDS:2 [Entrophospora sp. SA101]CAJ0746563.1 23751_t:CDS:2 [Entrophospora sp. SA101]CAJ0827239.1 16198_t:CDS:2 [Entrophospora sp. SA101]CAJ0840518.1 21135_t:CDS:2 [Entrophospora sp. SA101]